jgi:hypothetical protein
MGTRRCPPPACHLQGVAQPVFSNIQKSFSDLLCGADVSQNIRKISRDGYFINPVFSIFALMVFKFFAAILLKEIKLS